MNRRLIIFLSITIFVIVFITVLVVSMTQNNSDEPAGAQSNTSPEVITVLPSSDGKTPFLPIQQVQFTFSAPIDLASFSYTVSPKTETAIELSGDQRSVTISPKTIWLEGQVTTITISRRTKAISGKTLSKAFVYKLKAEFPEVAPDDHSTERY